MINASEYWLIVEDGELELHYINDPDDEEGETISMHATVASLQEILDEVARHNAGLEGL